MPVGSLSGAVLMLVAAPAAADQAVPVTRVAIAAYRLPTARPLAAMLRIDARQPRSDRVDAAVRPSVRDPQAECVTSLLRDRMARRGGALDAKVEWRLTGDRSDLGLAGGLARVVDTILHE